MTEELESLKRTVEKLNEGGFDYFLTGSMAMGFYSVPRMTRDADIVIQLFEMDSEKFVKLFSEDFFVDLNMIKDSLITKIMFNIFDKKTLFKIDFILKSNDTYGSNAFERKRKLKINNLELNVISLEDLIISKLNWAKDSYSELQLNDVRLLMKTDYDKNYVVRWISILNLNEVFKRV